jgi:hypothetical protein
MQRIIPEKDKERAAKEFLDGAESTGASDP